MLLVVLRQQFFSTSPTRGAGDLECLRARVPVCVGLIFRLSPLVLNYVVGNIRDSGSSGNLWGPRALTLTSRCWILAAPPECLLLVLVQRWPVSGVYIIPFFVAGLDRIAFGFSLVDLVIPTRRSKVPDPNFSLNLWAVLARMDGASRYHYCCFRVKLFGRLAYLCQFG